MNIQIPASITSALKKAAELGVVPETTLPNEKKKKIGEIDKVHFLSSLKEFSNISQKEIIKFSNSTRYLSLDPGEYITIEGDEQSHYGFIVVSGCLAMSKRSLNGKELIVELLQAGDIFGLLLMLAAGTLPVQLSAKALQRAEILLVPINNFIQLLASNSILFKEIAAHLLVCLQSSYNLSRGLAHDKVDVRIASVLSTLALKFSKQTSLNSPYTIKFTRQQLADLTGTILKQL